MKAALVRLIGSSVNYWAGFGCDLGVSIALVIGGLIGGAAVAPALTALVLGAATYSFYEYAFHRWLYHGDDGVFVEVHGLHHRAPRARHGAPFFYAVAVCGVTWGVSALAVGAAVAAVFAGTVLLGHAAQGALHHLIHHGRGGGAHLRRLRHRHLLHHRRGRGNFGVTSALWDRLLGTFLGA